MENVTTTDSKEYPSGISLKIIITTCIIASLLELIDTTIVNVSLRHISGSIGASTTDVAWVITAYAISNVIIIPLTGMLSELFGTKRYFTFSILLFTLSSFMCGNSTLLWELVLWRFIQGLGGGALMTLSQSILAQSFPPKKLGVASTIYGIGVAMGPAIGPTLGGFITDNYSWKWIFFVNVPIGILAAIAAWSKVPNQKNILKRQSIDWWGIVSLAVGIGSLQYVLEEGNSKDWFDDKSIVTFSVAAIIGLISFIIIEMKSKSPAVNLHLMKQKNLAIGILLNFMMGALLYIAIYAFPLLAQINLNWTATLTGTALAPGAIMAAIGMIFCQKMMSRGMDPKILMSAGLICTFVFGAWMSFQSADSSWNGLFIPLLLRGLGVGLFMLPAIILAMQGLKGADLGQSAGLSNMAKQLGGAIGIAMIGTQITHSQAFHQSVLSTHITQYTTNAIDAANKLTGFMQNAGLTHDNAQAYCYSILNGQVYKQASLLSYLSSFRVLAIVSLVGLFFMFFLKNKKAEAVITPKTEISKGHKNK